MQHLTSIQSVDEKTQLIKEKKCNNGQMFLTLSRCNNAYTWDCFDTNFRIKAGKNETFWWTEVSSVQTVNLKYIIYFTFLCKTEGINFLIQVLKVHTYLKTKECTPLTVLLL